MKQGKSDNGTLPLRAKVMETIREFNLIQQGDKVLVAVSGGPDSCLLLHLLLDLSRSFSLQLGVAHVNHGTRPEAADREALEVENLARRHNLPFHLHQAKLAFDSGSFEERARQVRYDFFDRVAREKGYTKIALGHQADDNAEVVLMNLLRGSGRRGLAGIPISRGGRIIRPMLHLRRHEILRYLAYHNLTYATDLSNLDRRFERNRVRHDLIPLLQGFCNGDLVATLNRMAGLFRDEEQWFEIYLRPTLDKMILAADARHMAMNASLLRDRHAALQRLVLRQALRNWIGHLCRINADHIDALRKILDPESNTRAVSLPGNVTAVRRDNQLIFRAGCRRQKSGPGVAPEQQVRIVPDFIKDTQLEFPLWGIRMRFALTENVSGRLPANDLEAVVFDADQVDSPLCIRSIRAGDRIQPLGMHGSKKISDLFIDLKIPRDRRTAIPLLFAGDTLLWVVGIRRSAHAKVTPATRRVLKVACTQI